MSCFVPDCNNSIGMPFPENRGTKRKWLESLGAEIEPTEKSFVCLDHFRPSDVIEQSDDVLEGDLNPEWIRNLVVLKKGAVPLISHDESNEEQEEIKVCRVCGSEDNLERNIMEKMENGVTIMSMIMLCCYPIVITKSDNLPKLICTNCMNQLLKAFKFRLKCLKTNKIFKEKLKKEVELRQEEEVNKHEIRIRSNEELITILKSDDNSDLKNDLNTDLKNDSQNDLRNDSQNDLRNDFKNDLKNDPKNDFKNDFKNCSKIDFKSDFKNCSKSDFKNDFKNSSKNDPKNDSKNDFKNDSKYDFKTDLKKESKIRKEINLPKGIRITTLKQTYQSEIGNFSYSHIKGPLDTEYVISDGYLFTFGLIKQNVRYLKCILPNCKAKAKETLTSPTETFLQLEIPHNHEKPTEQMAKKHMFFHIMRKRMQLHKGLNIRSMYEEICLQEPDIKKLVPLRNVINEICKHQTLEQLPNVLTFEKLYEKIEEDVFERLQFTSDNKQFYQERFATEDGCFAIVFCNTENIEKLSSNLMYVDGSFQINNSDYFEYHLITVLVWLDESYYPILFALVNKKSQEIFVKIFKHLRDVLAPNLKPFEIVTDYESNLYYALGETYLDSHIGGSVYYYVQNIYKKICSLNLAKDLESDSNFRNIYHMLLMLPLLPVNTIEDALNTIKSQALELNLDKANEIFEYISEVWIKTVTPELFCVHHLENRINERVIAPFKKLRDYLLLHKGKTSSNNIKVLPLIEKLIELESFLRDIYSRSDKKSFTRDLSSFQKRNVIRAWLHIETHPKININNFFQKVLGYIKCMENQLWIWGFYGYSGTADEVLISSGRFETAGSVTNDEGEEEHGKDVNTIVMEAVIDNNGGVVIQSEDLEDNNRELTNSLLTYVDIKNLL